MSRVAQMYRPSRAYALSANASAAPASPATDGQDREADDEQRQPGGRQQQAAAGCRRARRQGAQDVGRGRSPANPRQTIWSGTTAGVQRSVKTIGTRIGAVATIQPWIVATARDDELDRRPGDRRLPVPARAGAG